jgi:dienelactone hydrolase
MNSGPGFLRRFRIFGLLAVCAVVASSCLVPATISRYTFVVESDVIYGQGEIGGGGSFTDLRLDLYIPEVVQPQRLPLMVMIHGGGFVSGSKSGADLVSQAEAYAERGWLVASMDYRLLGDGPVPSARMQPMLDAGASFGDPVLANAAISAVDDTLTALQFLQARPDVYSPWTVLWGSSAGAVTALLTGYSLDDFNIPRPLIAAVIDLWGGFYGGAVGTPFDGGSPSDPDLFVVHGTADGIVPYTETLQIEAWADDADMLTEIYPIVGAGHGVNMFTTEASPGVSLFQRTNDWMAFAVFSSLPQGPYAEYSF